ncbi:MAG: hypothetical protein KDC05_07805 [Bacteroidales bacterium]|nr:hypothetical protein [Bacteroidales bacterium]
MKTLFKILGIIIVILIVAILLLPVLFKGKITELVKTEINNNINAKVDFTGINLSLIKSFPNFNLGIENLSIVGKDSFEGDTLSSIQNIDITLDLMSVINGSSYEVKRITINQPRIFVRVKEDGSANYDIALPSEEETVDETTTEENGDSYVLSLKHLEINNGLIVYDDKELGFLLEMAGFDHTLSGDLSEDKTVLKTNTSVHKFTVGYEGINYLSNTNLVYKADIDADLKNEIYTLSKNNLKLNELEIAFDGSVSMVGEDINLVLTFEAPKTEFKHILSLVPVIYAKDFESIQTSGKLALDGNVKGLYNEENLPSFNVNLAVSDAMFKYPDLPAAVTDVNIQTSVTNPGGDADNTVVNISKFHMEMGKNPIDMHMVLKTPVSDPDIDGNIKGKLDLATVKDFYPLEEGEELTGNFIADITLQGKLSAIETENYQDFTAIGSMLVKNFEYKSAYVDQLIAISNAQLNFSPQYLDLVDFKSNIGRNDFSANGKIENYLGYAMSDGTLKGNLTTYSDYFNVSDIMPADDGSADPETDAEPADTSAMSVVEVPGNIDFEMKTTFKSLIYDNIEMSNVGGRLVIRDKQIVLDRLAMNVLDGEMEVSGKYATPDPTQPEIDFHLNISDIDIQQAYNTFAIISEYAPIAEKTSGKFNTEMDLTSKLDTEMNPVYETMNGGGEIRTSPIVIKDVNTLNKIADALKYDKIRQMTIDKIQFEFRFEEGKVIVEPFDMKVNDLNANLGGYTALDQSIDYTLALELPRNDIGQAANNVLSNLVDQANAKGANFSLGETIDLNLLIGGTLTDPTVSTDLKDTGKNLVKDVKDKVKEEIENKKEEISKEVRDKAQKILDDADEQAKKIVSEAERQAENIRQGAAKAAADIRSEADKQAGKIESEGKKKGFLAEAAAKESAKKIRKEADDKANKLVKEADDQAKDVVRKANDEANRIRAKAQDEADKLLQRN